MYPSRYRVRVWRDGKTKSLGRTPENSSRRFLMAPWSLAEILQIGALIPSSGILLVPSVDASGAIDGNLDGNDEAGFRPQSPKFCSVSTVAGRKWDCEPISSKKMS